jgi:hypothetical protein
MKLSSVVPLMLAAAFALFAQDALPRMTTVDPGSAKVGDVLTVAGENLDKANVGKVYLTDGTNDLLCDVTSQTATQIKIKVPAKATGRLALMILTAAKEVKDQKLIEQPVKVTIE